MKLNIDVQTSLWRNECFFHPSASPWVNGILIMTLQTIRGSDFFGPVKWCFSKNNGKTWSTPENIPSLNLRQISDEVSEGIADVRPFLHQPTQKIIAIGCNTYYSAKSVLLQEGAQFPVYAILAPDGSWSERHILKGESFEQFHNYRAACAQLIIMPDGDVLIPLYLQENNAVKRYSVCSVLCSFKDDILEIKATGNLLTNAVARGFVEPSLVFLDGKFYMTIRAEDDHGYFAESDDGVNWSSPRAWRWDSGEELRMSTTQQHWLIENNTLYLVYTRQTDENKDVPRWRSPLFICQFDHRNGTLLRETEQVVFPMVYHDGLPNLMGNFHVCALSNGESLITVGSWWKSNPYHTEVWMARVKASSVVNT